MIKVETIEWNWPQQITPRFTEAEMNEALLPIIEENQRLKALLSGEGQKN